MTTSVRDLQERSLGATMRRDAWWIQPALTAIVLGSFGIYATWAAWVGNHYEWGPYLSPFYSPLIQTTWWPLSPAFLILIFPLGFRATCYYYRKAYYRSFVGDPAACAVGELKSKGYCGELKFPFVLQNLHRYFLYFAIIVLGFLWYDAGRAFFFDGELGVGIGTLVLLVNVVALTAFTFGCNSARHLVGGKLDCFTCSRSARVRGRLWHRLGPLNARHMEWAWISLAWVAIADLYIRLAASGVFDDPRIF